MPRIPGFRSDTQRERFLEARALYACGGPLARECGAKLRTGGVCTQLALAGETRCLRHGGPAVARRFRERQLRGFENGSVSAEEWARAEAKRARNALTDAWRKNPALPGATIDLGPDEGAFVAACAARGVDAGALYPAVADWLRWRWQRHQKDRANEGLWRKAVQEGLPRQWRAAETAMGWLSIGITDRRTRAAQAAKAAMRVGDLEGARAAVAAAERASGASGAVAGADRAAGKPAGPLTAFPARAWAEPPAGGGWKRRQADRTKIAPPAPTGPPKPVGRPRRVPDGPDELAALVEVLRGAGPQARGMYDAIPRQEDKLRFLRDLAAYVNAPGDAGALHRWVAWVVALR